MATAAARKTEDNEAVEPERAPEIDPKSVKVNSAGQCWRTLEIRCPEAVIQDDLRSPSIWRRVQAVPQAALIKNDELRIVAHDESWLALAVVNFADSTSASLTILKVSGFREKDAALFADETYRVVWLGSGGYGIQRISDDILMSNQTWPMEAGAIAAIRQLYPTEAGGQVIGQ